MLTKAAIQRLRSLREKKHRAALGLFVVEGEKVVGELLAAKFAFEEIYATPAWTGPRTAEVTEEEMARASHFPTPSSVLAVGKISHAPLPSGGLARGLTLALDGVQDPGNVGTLLRIADWFALDRVVLSPDCADLFSQKVINASMGSFARVTVHTADLAADLADHTADSAADHAANSAANSAADSSADLADLAADSAADSAADLAANSAADKSTADSQAMASASNIDKRKAIGRIFLILHRANSFTKITSSISSLPS